MNLSYLRLPFLLPPLSERLQRGRGAYKAHQQLLLHPWCCSQASRTVKNKHDLNNPAEFGVDHKSKRNPSKHPQNKRNEIPRRWLKAIGRGGAEEDLVPLATRRLWSYAMWLPRGTVPVFTSDSKMMSTEAHSNDIFILKELEQIQEPEFNLIFGRGSLFLPLTLFL